MDYFLFCIFYILSLFVLLFPDHMYWIYLILNSDFGLTYKLWLYAIHSSVFSSSFFDDFYIIYCSFIYIMTLCLFFTCISYETNTFILYIPRMFLNSWFVSMFYGNNWRIIPWLIFLTSSPWKPGWVIKEFGFLVSFTVPHRIRRKITVSHLESGIRVRV